MISHSYFISLPILQQENLADKYMLSGHETDHNWKLFRPDHTSLTQTVHQISRVGSACSASGAFFEPLEGAVDLPQQSATNPASLGRNQRTPDRDCRRVSRPAPKWVGTHALYLNGMPMPLHASDND